LFKKGCFALGLQWKSFSDFIGEDWNPSAGLRINSKPAPLFFRKGNAQMNYLTHIAAKFFGNVKKTPF